MDTLIKDWTHKEIKITDIRILSEFFYIFTVEGIPGVLLVKRSIFDERIKCYFLNFLNQTPNRVSREEILSVKWNMYITRGYYVKIQPEENFQIFEQDPNKYYVSYLDIAGPLGTFQRICKDKEKIK